MGVPVDGSRPSDSAELAFALVPGRIDVFLTFYDDIRNETLLTRYQQLLSIDELACARRLRDEQQQRQYVAARVLARTTLSCYFAVRPEAWRFTPGAYGRPEVAQDHAAGVRRVSFNLAHTRGLVVMAVGCDRVVGVDAEKLSSERAAGAIARRFFTAREADALFVLPPDERQERFFEYWTLKESHVKARGQGLAIPLDSFSFDLDADGAIRLCDPATGEGDVEWQFWQWREAAGYVVAVCSGPSARPDTEIAAWNVVPMSERHQHPVRLVRTSVSPRAGDPNAPQQM